jgi:glutathione S-transferase
MLKLSGFSASNYYNKVKLALLEKNVPFEEESIFPSQEETMLCRSPMGKVPFLQVNGTTISESQVVTEYLEDAYPRPPLYPGDPLERAKCREIIVYLELHVELQARRLFPEAIWGKKVSDEVKQDVNKQLDKGVKALARIVKFSPYIAGAEITFADCAALCHFPLISQVTKTIYGEDRLAAMTQIPAYLNMLKERPQVRKVLDDRKAGMAAFNERVERVRNAARA